MAERLSKLNGMSLLSRNLLANFMGRGWAGLMNLAFVPLFIRFMGIEAYGLVGFYTTLVAVLSVLDLGLSTTLNREMARYSTLPNEVREMRDTVRTLEMIYWGLAFLIGLTVICLSPLIARRWLRAATIQVDVVQSAVMLMGIVIAFQWPLNFYAGGLLGLQRQVMYNSLNATWFTLRFAGAALLLWLVSPTILAFFTYQAIVSVLSAIVTGLLLWRSLPYVNQRARFQVERLRLLWRFTAGMSAISVTVVFLNQLDKIILSKLLSLEMFGYYVLAWTLGASSMAYLAHPVFTSVFPRFVQRVANDDGEGLKSLYHWSSQLGAVIILPTAMVLVFFAPQILLIWTRNSNTVENTQVLVRLMAIGFSFNALMAMPYALQLAHGWTKLTFYTNLAAAIFLGPAVLIMAWLFGVVGVAAIWTFLNLGLLLIVLPIMHKRLLRGELWRWYSRDVGLPFLATLGTVSAGWLLIRNQPFHRIIGFEIIAVLGLSYAAAALSARSIRVWALTRFQVTKGCYSA
ncbi:MAG TPA: oligosaccharide flippase family protein [Pyrinomonadaceae bacterium]|nr:oligosaccharide flippase family protein [Pyrinomonadaceae bacterium]